MSNNKYQYPKQVVSLKRKSKIIGADAELFLPTDKEIISPLEIHSGFSRFVFTIVDNTTDKTITPTANIPAREVAFIKKMTDVAIDKMADGVVEKADALSDSIAYSVKLLDKNFKGKTPAEVLLANPADKENLAKVKDWLKLNLNNPSYAKFKDNNTKQINAIEEAINLFDIGELQQQRSASASNITIYSTDYKFKNKTNDKGYNLVYSISIICDPSRNYPFTVNITNCYAPVETNNDGTKNIKMTEAVDTIKSSFSMSSAEWYGFIDRIDRTLFNFENMNFATQFGEAMANSYQHDSDKK